MHYRSAVLIVIAISLTLGATLQAQFVSPGAAAAEAIREDAARREEQRRQDERERIARERLALEERRIAIQEQLVAEEAASAKEEQAAPVPEPTPAAEPFSLVLVDRDQLAAVVQYLHDVGLSSDQLRDVLDLLLEARER